MTIRLRFLTIRWMPIPLLRTLTFCRALVNLTDHGFHVKKATFKYCYSLLFCLQSCNSALATWYLLLYDWVGTILLIVTYLHWRCSPSARMFHLCPFIIAVFGLQSLVKQVDNRFWTFYRMMETTNSKYCSHVKASHITSNFNQIAYLSYHMDICICHDGVHSSMCPSMSTAVILHPRSLDCN